MNFELLGLLQRQQHELDPERQLASETARCAGALGIALSRVWFQAQLIREDEARAFSQALNDILSHQTFELHQILGLTRPLLRHVLGGNSMAEQSVENWILATSRRLLLRNRLSRLGTALDETVSIANSLYQDTHAHEARALAVSRAEYFFRRLSDLVPLLGIPTAEGGRPNRAELFALEKELRSLSASEFQLILDGCDDTREKLVQELLGEIQEWLASISCELNFENLEPVPYQPSASPEWLADRLAQYCFDLNEQQLARLLSSGF
jgi:hypothetical protein